MTGGLPWQRCDVAVVSECEDENVLAFVAHAAGGRMVTPTPLLDAPDKLAEAALAQLECGTMHHRADEAVSP